MGKVRVRFAPSPTGYLHVGGARTALYNYLFARHLQGTFILRIEDTDLARSSEESVRGVLEGMEFLGLEWDEGPYYQSQRLDLYREAADKLLESGRAYHCYCTPEELDQMRAEAMENKEDPIYNRRCRYLTVAEQQELEKQGKTSILRFKSDNEGVTSFKDIIKGQITFDNKLADDFVIWKSDGMPTYNFCVVIDDALMDITHIIRGDDHVSNTPKQIQLYEALGYKVPEFAHVPMILGEDRARLSKRHGATSVTQFRDEGYLAEAMNNYLALLGWAYDDSQTLFSMDDLIKKFSLERVSHNPAVFDIQKLQWMNGVYIRDMDLEELYNMVLPQWHRAGFLSETPSKEEADKAKAILKELQSRVRLLNELDEAAYYFFEDQLRYNEGAVNKILYKPGVADILTHLSAELIKVQDFTEENLAPIFKATTEKFDCRMGEIMQPVRVAVTGTNVSPSIYPVLTLIGRAKTCQRLRDAVEKIKSLEKEG